MPTIVPPSLAEEARAFAIVEFVRATLAAEYAAPMTLDECLELDQRIDAIVAAMALDPRRSPGP